MLYVYLIHKVSFLFKMIYHYIFFAFMINSNLNVWIFPSFAFYLLKSYFSFFFMFSEQERIHLKTVHIWHENKRKTKSRLYSIKIEKKMKNIFSFFVLTLIKSIWNFCFNIYIYREIAVNNSFVWTEIATSNNNSMICRLYFVPRVKNDIKFSSEFQNETIFIYILRHFEIAFSFN